MAAGRRREHISVIPRPLGTSKSDRYTHAFRTTSVIVGRSSHSQPWLIFPISMRQGDAIDDHGSGPR
jgi:hypothetical protein